MNKNLNTGMERGSYTLFGIVIVLEVLFWIEFLSPTITNGVACVIAALAVSYFLAYSRTAIPHARHQMQIRGISNDKLTIFTFAELATYSILVITILHMLSIFTLNNERAAYEKDESVVAAKMALVSRQSENDLFSFGYTDNELSTAKMKLANLNSEKEGILQEQLMNNTLIEKDYNEKVKAFWSKTWHCKYASNDYSCTAKKTKHTTSFIMNRDCSPNNNMVTASKHLCPQWKQLEAESPASNVTPRILEIDVEVAGLESGPLKALREKGILKANLLHAQQAYEQSLIKIGADSLERNAYELMAAYVDAEKTSITSKSFSMLVNILLVVLMGAFLWIYGFTSARMALPVKEELLTNTTEKESFSSLMVNGFKSIIYFFKKGESSTKDKAVPKITIPETPTKNVKEPQKTIKSTKQQKVKLDKSDTTLTPVTAGYQGTSIGFGAEPGGKVNVKSPMDPIALKYFVSLVQNKTSQNKAAKMVCEYFGLTQQPNGTEMMKKSQSLGYL